MIPGHNVTTVTEGTDLVGPLDNEKVMEKKLRGVRFMLDNGTGNIVAVSSNGDQIPRQSRLLWPREGRDDSQEVGYELDDRKSLLSVASEGYTDHLQAHSAPTQ